MDLAVRELVDTTKGSQSREEKGAYIGRVLERAREKQESMDLQSREPCDRESKVIK